LYSRSYKSEKAELCLEIAPFVLWFKSTLVQTKGTGFYIR